MTVRTTILITLLALAGCSDDDAPAGVADSAVAADGGAPDTSPPDSSAVDRLAQLAAWMTGGFSSAKQAQSDPTYYDVTLVMKRIWAKSKKPGYWLYVEQAITGSKPYRQRVYYLEDKGGKLVSRVFDFKDPARRAAAVDSWKQADPLDTLGEADLVEKTGCGVVLTFDTAGAMFGGATEGKQCLSTLSGASYATSKVQVSKGKMTSWDQGFDSSDKQVWGAVAGPYVFDLVKDMDTDLDR